VIASGGIIIIEVNENVRNFRLNLILILPGILLFGLPRNELVSGTRVRQSVDRSTDDLSDAGSISFHLLLGAEDYHLRPLGSFFGSAFVA